MSKIWIPPRKIQANFKPDFPVEIDPKSPVHDALFYYLLGSNNFNAVDISARQNNGTVVAPFNNSIGLIGRQASFTGTNQEIKTPININNYPDVTVLWVMRPTVAYNSGVIDEFWAQIGSTTPEFSAQHYSDNNLYIGWNRSGSDQRVALPASATNWITTKYTVWALTVKSGGYTTIYQNGKQIGINGGGTTTGGATDTSLYIGGNGVIGSTLVHSSSIFSSFCIVPRCLSAVEIAQLGGNVAFGLRTKQRPLMIAVGGGTPANNLTGTAAESQSASGIVAIGVPIVAASIQTQTASGGILQAGVQVSGSAIATQSASGALSIAIPLSAAASQLQSATGNIGISVTLAGNAFQEAYASGVLTNTAAGGVALAGTSGQSQSASGLLSIGVNPSGASLVIQSATGNLTQIINLSGISVQAHQASGGLIVTANLAGQTIQDAFAQAALSNIPSSTLSGTTEQSQSAIGGLTLRINLDGQSVQQAIASGYLSNSGILISDSRYTIYAQGRNFTIYAQGRSFIL